MSLIIENLPLILTLIASAITAIWSYFTNKKNKELSTKLQEVQVKLQETEVDSGKIKVATENFEFYQSMLDDAHMRYQTLMREYANETTKLNKLLEETRKMVDTHEQYISRQRIYIAELEAILNKNNIKFDNNEKE